MTDRTLRPFWPVPLAVHSFAQAGDVNPELVREFQSRRAADSTRDRGAFYVSTDDLLHRIKLPAFQALVQFIVASLQTTVQQVNAGHWPAAPRQLQLEIVGIWFQIQNGHAFHDVHTHGNCSWSGVYYVQIDAPRPGDEALRRDALNGSTRFYSPMYPLLGGAYMDWGNAWLQAATYDHLPHEGELVLFPAFLPHTALPYQGQKDRIVVSFNAQIRSPAGDQPSQFSAP